MRFRETQFKIYLLIWVIVLLEAVLGIVRNVMFYGNQYFLTLGFYLDIAMLGAMIFLLVALLKDNIRLIVIAFSLIVIIEAIRHFETLIDTIGYLGMLWSWDYTRGERLLILTRDFMLPLSVIIYALTYIVCMIFYFLNKRFRHTLVPIVSALGIVIIIAELASILFTYIAGTVPEFSFFDIFFDLVLAVFFHVIYVYIPRLMHNNNL